MKEHIPNTDRSIVQEIVMSIQGSDPRLMQIASSNVDYGKINSLPAPGGPWTDSNTRPLGGIVNGQTKNYISRRDITDKSHDYATHFIMVSFKGLVIKFQTTPERGKEFLSRLDMITKYTGGVPVQLDTEILMAELLAMGNVVKIYTEILPGLPRFGDSVINCGAK